jgi:hypothetical protein
MAWCLVKHRDNFTFYLYTFRSVKIKESIQKLNRQRRKYTAVSFVPRNFKNDSYDDDDDDDDDDDNYNNNFSLFSLKL